MVQQQRGNVTILLLAGMVVFASMILSPTPTVVSFFGWPIPELCVFRRLMDMNCPGCGLTRSFVFLGHGQLSDAWRMNPVGPLLYFVVVSQIPWRLWKIFRG